MLRMLWVAAYDVSDDRQRRLLEKRLASTGERVQFSVFESWLSARERTRLMRTVDSEVLLQGSSDSVRWYGLCGHCQRQLRFVGRGIQPDDPRYYVV